MRSSARIFVLLENLFRPSLKLLLALLLALPFFLFPTKALAQANQSFAPLTESNVPLNQHTYMQTIFIEAVSTLYCQIAGIDPLNPEQSCLGINPVTHKIGYETRQTGQIGGLLGTTTGMITSLYTPTTSTQLYFKDLADNFGLVKKTHAETFSQGMGYDQLAPIREIWKIFRNIAYTILILAFIFIGVGVMLRVKIDPRTVMTIQNQLPRIVIAILLITFSYAISALMIDLMWVSTYVGINSLTDRSIFAGTSVPGGEALSAQIAKESTSTIMSTPLTFFNETFRSTDGAGIFHITNKVSAGIGSIVTDLTRSLFNTDPNGCNIMSFNPISCVGVAFSSTLGFIATIVMWLVILCVILIVLFRVWFELLKAYTFLLFYIISAPIWIVASLLPGRPLGFGKWMRNIFVNLAVFPLVAFLFVGARVFMELFNQQTNINPNSSFIPPLIGNPNMQNFGTLIAFGILLMAPQLLNMMREAMKVPGTKYGAAIGDTMKRGGAIPGAVAQKQWASLTRRNPQTGAGQAPLSRMADRGTAKIVDVMGSRLPAGIGGAVKRYGERRRNLQEGLGFYSDEELAAKKIRTKAPGPEVDEARSAVIERLKDKPTSWKTDDKGRIKDKNERDEFEKMKAGFNPMEMAVFKDMASDLRRGKDTYQEGIQAPNTATTKAPESEKEQPRQADPALVAQIMKDLDDRSLAGSTPTLEQSKAREDYRNGLDSDEKKAAYDEVIRNYESPEVGSQQNQVDLGNIDLTADTVNLIGNVGNEEAPNTAFEQKTLADMVKEKFGGDRKYDNLNSTELSRLREAINDKGEGYEGIIEKIDIRIENLKKETIAEKDKPEDDNKS